MSIQTVVQILAVIIILGMLYSLWQTTRAYGGLIGAGLRWIGLGMVVFSLEALDRVLGNLSYISSFSSGNPELAHNIVLLLALIFSGIGFSYLTKVTK